MFLFSLKPSAIFYTDDNSDPVNLHTYLLRITKDLFKH